MKSLSTCLGILPALCCLAQGAGLDGGAGTNSVPVFAAATSRRAEYQAELERFRNEFVKRKLAAPHTWHAAEMFLGLFESNRR